MRARATNFQLLPIATYDDDDDDDDDDDEATWGASFVTTASASAWRGASHNGLARGDEMMTGIFSRTERTL